MDIIIRAIYPTYLLLRFTDRAIPTMDKLYYYVRRVDASVQASVDNLNSLDDLYKEINVARQTVDNYIDDGDGHDSEYDGDDNDIDSIKENEYNLGDMIMDFWNKCKSKLIHDYSLTS